MAGSDGQVEAAGGVLWRPAGGAGFEVAVVHRPRYDDWSLPKGKLEPGEHPLLGALREVGEETGWSAVAGRRLGSSRYEVLQEGRLRPKRVRWWALRATDGRFEPGEEVDALRWLPPAEAAALLTAHRDAAPLQRLVADGPASTTVLLVRHGRAGERRTWPGEDSLRPLDERGRAQARALAGLLPAYGPVRVLSAPVLRCVQTVQPLADRLGLPVERDDALSDAAWERDPEQARACLSAVATGAGAVVLSSQGAVVPGLVQGLLAQAGRADPEVRAGKGSVWALTVRAGHLLDADHLPAPA